MKPTIDRNKLKAREMMIRPAHAKWQIHKFRVHAGPCDDGRFIAIWHDHPGTFALGETFDMAMMALSDLISDATWKPQ
jgi:hypothetical protein